jgi:FixJ family two-component response regulator
MPEKMKPIVYIVDDDESVRRATKRLIYSMGMEARTFPSASEFLEFKFRGQNACLIVDVEMKGLSGLELNRKLVERGDKLPVIYLTAFDTEDARNQARKADAIAYLRKPVDDQALLDAIWYALSDRFS